MYKIKAFAFFFFSLLWLLIEWVFLLRPPPTPRQPFQSFSHSQRDTCIHRRITGQYFLAISLCLDGRCEYKRIFMLDS